MSVPRSSEADGFVRVPCDNCGITDEVELSLRDRDGSFLRTVICRQCGLVYSNPRPAEEKVRNYYAEEYRQDYKATYQPKPKHVYRAGLVALERIRSLRRHLKPGDQLLDFGAGGGEVVFMLRALGFSATGFEPNEGYASFAADVLGAPVVRGFYQDLPVAENSLDFVTAFHVMEHLESPIAAMRRIWTWLKDGGRLLIEVPNVEAICQWPQSRFHRAHLYNFSPASLELAGNHAGFVAKETFVSADGGNLAILFEKSTAPVPAKANPENFAKVSKIVRSHTPAKHLLSLYPYIRPFKRFAARIRERLALWKSLPPRAILERLVECEKSRQS